jgi:hypothetical protein
VYICKVKFGDVVKVCPIPDAVSAVTSSGGNRFCGLASKKAATLILQLPQSANLHEKFELYKRAQKKMPTAERQAPNNGYKFIQFCIPL